MPVSKRDKKVSLTKTQKKGMTNKRKIVDEIRENLEKYNNLFVFSVSNVRNGPLKEVRDKWRDIGRFFFAKNTIMALALGRSPENEVKKDLHKISSFLHGAYGLFLTNKPKDEVVQWFESYSKLEYARAGFSATETVELPAGPLPEFAPAMESHLRQLGMPTQLEKGVIVLRENFTVCTKGSHLTPQQASILKLLKKQLAEFKLVLISAWSKDGTFETFQAAKEFKRSMKLKHNVKSINPIKKEESNDDDDIQMDVEEEDVKKEGKVRPRTKNQRRKNILKQRRLNQTPKGTPNQVDTTSNQENDTSTVTPKQNNKTPNQTPKQNNKTPNQTPKPNNKTPNQTPKQNKTPNQTPKQNDKTPAQTPKQNDKTPAQTPKQNDKTPAQTPKQKNKTPNQTPKQNNKTPEMTLDQSKISKPISPKKQQVTPVKFEEETTQDSEMKEDTQSEFDELESLQVEPSPKLGKANPRRSMRTPKPVKRTPEQRRMSVKKLTDPAGRKGTPKGTPKKAASARKSRLPNMAE